MKIQLFVGCTNSAWLKNLQHRINLFMKDKHIIDVKYCASTDSDGVCLHVLVMYEEKDEA